MGNLDVKDFSQVTELADDDRLLITRAANNHYAASMTVAQFKSAFLAPLIESTTPTNAMKCVILTEEEYFALTSTDAKTLYVITGANETTGEIEITSAYLGNLKFATGGGGTDSGIPIEQLTLSDFEITLEKGATKLVTASWQPENATSTTLSWISSNTLVATVNAGTITGVNKGTAVITVKAKSGVNDTINVNVIVTLTALSLEASKTELTPSEVLEVTAVTEPVDADIDLSWNSSHPLLVGVEKSQSNSKKATINAGVTGSGLLTVLTGSTTSGFLFLKLDKIIEVPVTAGQTAIQIADQIRLMVIEGWTIGGTIGTNLVSFSKVGTGLCYLPALNDAITAAEVDTLEITTIPDKSGNITINLDGVDFVVSIDSTVQTSRTATATKIASTSFSGWTVSSLNKLVTFTSTTTGRRSYPTLIDTDGTGIVGIWRRPTRGDGLTGVTANFVSNDVNIIDVTATDIKGKSAKISFSLKPYVLTIDSSNINKTDNSVTSIFTTWNITRSGGISKYKYKEYYMNGETPYIYQQSDYISIPENNQIVVDLYAEFGNKILEWTFSDDAENEKVISINILYKEAELVHHSFDIDVTCTPEEAAIMTAEIPFYKYDKKFCQNIRNDDGRPSMWRTIFRYCDRRYDRKQPGYSGTAESEFSAMSEVDKQRAPRRLGYTDGTGILKVFVFDTAGNVTVDPNNDGKSSILFWNQTEYGDRVTEEDFWRAKDYGGHYLVHNMPLLDSDAAHYTPKYPYDYTYALQRDRQAIYDKFGYTSLHFANPDGAWWYTRPVIKDPKTLLMSGGGTAYNTDPDGMYGKPSNRQIYVDDLSSVPLFEIRNTLLVNYEIYNNWMERNTWISQLQNFNVNNKYTFKCIITHNAGYYSETDGNLKNTQNYFSEIHDVVGANGNDYIWICSGDEMIEYMYYQRCATVTKTITPTGCRFNVSFNIPDYLSYKTYSLKIKGLPVAATVTMNTNETLTYYSKNMSTGLINWGISLDISERANRYIAAYIANPTNENLDRAWYFVRQMGEIGLTLAAQLPSFNEVPILDSVTYNNAPTGYTIDVSTVNSNKEFGEAEFLDIAKSPDFSDKASYQIPFDSHKFYNSLDATCKQNNFNVSIGPNFGVVQQFYARLRNVYGASNTKQISLTLTRTSGVNDPNIEYVLPAKFSSDTEVIFSITHSYISAMRYKLTDTFTEWMSVSNSITIPMSKGTTYTLVVQGKNNLDEIVEKTYTIKFTGIPRVMIFANITDNAVISGIGFVNSGTDGYHKGYDLSGAQMCSYYAASDTSAEAMALKSYWGIVGNVSGNPAYWKYPVFTEEGEYPSTMINTIWPPKTNVYISSGQDPTYQCIYKLLYNVPAGKYKVRLLITSSNATRVPNTLRVNNSIQTITDGNYVINNNTNWIVFDNVEVASNGYLLISQYPETVITSGYLLTPIAIAEISKIE